jgi:hypothetical protein
MQNIHFNEVKLAGLSQITHQILLSEHENSETPEFKVIRYIGIYKPGSAGADDFAYIYGVFNLSEIWFSEATILDFSQLDYR